MDGVRLSLGETYQCSIDTIKVELPELNCRLREQAALVLIFGRINVCFDLSGFRLSPESKGGFNIMRMLVDLRTAFFNANMIILNRSSQSVVFAERQLRVLV